MYHFFSLLCWTFTLSERMLCSFQMLNTLSLSVAKQPHRQIPHPCSDLYSSSLDVEWWRRQQRRRKRRDKNEEEKDWVFKKKIKTNKSKDTRIQTQYIFDSLFWGTQAQKRFCMSMEIGGLYSWNIFLSTFSASIFQIMQITDRVISF